MYVSRFIALVIPRFFNQSLISAPEGYKLYADETFDLEMNFILDGLWDPNSKGWKPYGSRLMKKLEIYDYEIVSQTEQEQVYKYEGLIAKYQLN